MFDSYINQTISITDVPANCSGADFTNCTFSGGFEGINFSFCLFEGCSFDDASFTDCNFGSAEFDTASDLDGATLSSCTRGGGDIDRTEYLIENGVTP
jgi:uncharacterized protein YjbI with pentapeptide repeats